MSKIIPSEAFADFNPVPTNGRHDGWLACKQQAFIETLAETGCVAHAAAEAGMSARSAYRFRMKEEAKDFAKAWDYALTLASTRLTAIAFDRAINGVVETSSKGGKIIAERRRYPDKMLMFLISHLDNQRNKTYQWNNGTAPHDASGNCPG